MLLPQKLDRLRPRIYRLKRNLAAFSILIAAVGSAACGRAPEQAESSTDSAKRELVVAAAANLTDAFGEIAAAFTKETGIVITHNFGATAQLAQQIEQGAPFDVFAAADVIHVDQLVHAGKVVPDSRAVYARGVLALWAPDGSRAEIVQLEDLLKPQVRYVAIANPELAPYGAAAVEALQKKGLWERVQPKIVRGENVSAAKQLASSGNAEAAFTAYSLVLNETGRKIVIEESLHQPIEQALGIVDATPRPELAEEYVNFVLRGGGPAILKRFGYDLPR
jgi:molybdate transport system substrate-binding protein